MPFLTATAGVASGWWRIFVADAGQELDGAAVGGQAGRLCQAHGDRLLQRMVVAAGEPAQQRANPVGYAFAP